MEILHLNEENIQKLFARALSSKDLGRFGRIQFPLFTESGLYLPSEWTWHNVTVSPPPPPRWYKAARRISPRLMNGLRMLQHYILTQCTYIPRLSPLRKQLLAVPYLFSPRQAAHFTPLLYNRHIRRPWSSSGRISSADPRVACGGWSRGPWKGEHRGIPGTRTRWGLARRKDTKSRGTAPPQTRWVVSFHAGGVSKET